MIFQQSHAQPYVLEKGKEKYTVKAVKTRFTVRQNSHIKEGAYTQFYNKTKLIEGVYKNDQKSGTWHYYDYQGKLNTTVDYKDDQLHGKYINTLEEDTFSIIYFTLGKIDSAFGYHKNGKPAFERKPMNDSMEICRSFYSNGQVKTITPLKHGQPDGIQSVFFKTGGLHRKIRYQAGKIDALLEILNVKGQPLDGNRIQNGSGTLNIYYAPDDSSSLLPVSAEYTYLAGIRHGTSRSYQRNGNLLEEGQYDSGYRAGKWQKYDEKGKPTAIYHYDIDSNYQFRPRTDVIIPYDWELMGDSAINFPSFPGGESALLKFIYKYVGYPKKARNVSLEGIVYIKFNINLFGEVDSYKIVKSIHPLLDNPVKRIVRVMPRWRSGFRDRMPVNITFYLPVKFKLI